MSLSDCRELDLQKKLGPFFVTCLPRSRSAWLANLFTTDTTICFHDVPFDLEKVDSGKVVGWSGSEIANQFTPISRLYPTAPWLVVLREQSTCLESFKRTMNVEVPSEYWKSRCDLLSSLCNKWQTKTVNFDELDSESVMRSVWAHLLPGIAFDVERYHLLCKMRITQKN